MCLFFEIGNIAVYVGLALPYLWRIRKDILTALVGLVVLVAMYAEFIAIMSMKYIYGWEESSGGTFQLIGSGMFLALPMARYWIISSLEAKSSSKAII
jgi:hypothetical protein